LSLGGIDPTTHHRERNDSSNDVLNPSRPLRSGCLTLTEFVFRLLVSDFHVGHTLTVPAL
jgi:hypothetical protein